MLGKAEYIGIDIGNYAIKIARVKRSGRSFVSSGLAYEILPENIRGGRYTAEMRDLVTNLLKFHKVSKGQPVIHVPAGDAIMRNVSVPMDTKKEDLEGAIELDLGPALPFGLDQVYFDFDDEADANGTYLAVAARRDLVDDRTNLFSNRPKTLNKPQVDVDVFAYERLIEVLSTAGEIGGSTIAVLDIGYSRSRVMVFKDHRYVFSRDPQIGGNHVNEIIRDVYDVDMETAEARKLNQNLGDEYFDLVLQPYANSLSEQINLAIDFYEASSADARRIDKIYVTGGGGLLKGLISALSDKLTVPIDKMELSQHIKLSAKQAGILQDGLSHSLAIALAMEGK